MKKSPLPWRYVGHNWHETSIYDAKDRRVCLFDTEDWGVNERNQDRLEAEQEELVKHVIKCVTNFDNLLRELDLCAEQLAHCLGDQNERVVAARAATTKARGES